MGDYDVYGNPDEYQIETHVDSKLQETLGSLSGGSDLHGVVQRVAFRIHKKFGREDTGANWNGACEAIRRYFKGNMGIYYGGGVNAEVKRQLAIRANQIGRNSGKSDFENWITASDAFADEIFDSEAIKMRLAA